MWEGPNCRHTLSILKGVSWDGSGYLVRMPPGRLPQEVFPGTSYWEEVPGQTQDSLEGLYVPSGLGTPRDPPGGVWHVWVSLLDLLPPRPDLGWADENEWFNWGLIIDYLYIIVGLVGFYLFGAELMLQISKEDDSRPPSPVSCQVKLPFGGFGESNVYCFDDFITISITICYI